MRQLFLDKKINFKNREGRWRWEGPRRWRLGQARRGRTGNGRNDHGEFQPGGQGVQNETKTSPSRRRLTLTCRGGRRAERAQGLRAEGGECAAWAPRLPRSLATVLSLPLVYARERNLSLPSQWGPVKSTTTWAMCAGACGCPSADKGGGGLGGASRPRVWSWPRAQNHASYHSVWRCHVSGPGPRSAATPPMYTGVKAK